MFTWGRLNIETWRAAVVTDDCINSSCLLIIHHPLWPSVTAKFCYKVDLRCLCWAQSLCACTVRGLRGWLRKVVVAVYLTNLTVVADDKLVCLVSSHWLFSPHLTTVNSTLKSRSGGDRVMGRVRPSLIIIHRRSDWRVEQQLTPAALTPRMRPETKTLQLDDPADQRLTPALNIAAHKHSAQHSLFATIISDKNISVKNIWDSCTTSTIILLTVVTVYKFQTSETKRVSEVSEVCTLDLIALLPGSTAPLFVNMKTQGLGLNKEMTAGHVKHLHINILCSHRLLTCHRPRSQGFISNNFHRK